MKRRKGESNSDWIKRLSEWEPEVGREYKIKVPFDTDVDEGSKVIIIEVQRNGCVKGYLKRNKRIVLLPHKWLLVPKWRK